MSDVDGVDSIGVGKISQTIDVSPNEKKSRSVIDDINDAAVPHWPLQLSSFPDCGVMVFVYSTGIW